MWLYGVHCTYGIKHGRHSNSRANWMPNEEWEGIKMSQPTTKNVLRLYYDTERNKKKTIKMKNEMYD